MDEKSILAIRPKPPFRALFEIATTLEGPGIVLVHEVREGGESLPQRAASGLVRSGGCFGVVFLVELGGIEPPTSSMP